MIMFDLPLYFVVFRTVADRAVRNSVTIKCGGGFVLQTADILRMEGYVSELKFGHSLSPL